MGRKIAIITIISFLAIIAINYVIYKILTTETPGADLNLASRGIETPLKLVLSGYLGLFFGFKYLGNINWLIIPLAITYFLVLKPKLAREHKALLLVFILTFILIAIKGYFNQRYQLTLLPIVFFFIFLFVWKIYSHFNNPFYLREIVSFFLLSTVVVFTLQTLFGTRAQAHISKIFNTNKKVENTENDIISVFELSEYVDSVETSNKTFLVNNLPDFYYHSHKKGLYYWCQDDFYYTNKGITKIFENRSLENAKQYLKDSLNCGYIYTMESYNKYNPKFEEFLTGYCTLIVKDRDNKQLFVINE